VRTVGALVRCGVGGKVVDETGKEAAEILSVLLGPVGHRGPEPPEHRLHVSVDGGCALLRRLDQSSPLVAGVGDPADQPTSFERVDQPRDVRSDDVHPIGDLSDAQRMTGRVQQTVMGSIAMGSNALGSNAMGSNGSRKVLVSGASIAGPTLAYWLHRYGFDVTVVEQAETLRGGGYPIDVRGTALEVIARTDLLPQVRVAHINSRRITFLNADSSLVGSVRPESLSGGVEGRDVELPRGRLTDILYGAVRDDVDFRFDDSVAELHDDGDGVDVTFRRGGRKRFDLVIGADGLHSHTRGLVLGQEERYHRYLGYVFAGFTMPNDFGLSHESVVWNTPGRAAVLSAPGDSDRVHALLSFARPEPPLCAFRNPEAQRDLVASIFTDRQWEIPRMVRAMRVADDLFFDVVSQIRMPRWSSGRVALVGDARVRPVVPVGSGIEHHAGRRVHACRRAGCARRPRRGLRGL
jgi:2-polyprenyl-6-methoxyphenol hydroxylase-like FAD-dependent oxidoreductase